MWQLSKWTVNGPTDRGVDAEMFEFEKSESETLPVTEPQVLKPKDAVVSTSAHL